MTKVKYLIITMLIIGILFLIPNISNAATEYTYQDAEQGIEWSYELDDSGNVINLICKTTTVSGTVTIPSSIDGKTVISLNGYYSGGAFNDCTGLTGIVIPDTIKTIGREAFSGCTGLKTVTIPNSVTAIGAYAFENCAGLTAITLSENLSLIDSYAFKSCSGLKSIIIPNSVTTIGKYAFSDCSGLKEITLSENLTKIDVATFLRCSGLKSVIIPDSVTTISHDLYGAFEECINLEKILIPDNVASIEKGAFYKCNKLTIYGNDGMTSKEFAEANAIKFDYIANWDNVDTGVDVTAPTVKKIEVTYESVMNYYDLSQNIYKVPSKAQLVINVEFSEAMQGATVPNLTIKFGEGENIQLQEGTINGSKITYLYTIKSTDEGTMTAVDYSGGNVTDNAGNAAILSCPGLRVEVLGFEIIYANGKQEKPDNIKNPGDGSNGKPGSGNNNTTVKPGEEDKTTAPGELPKAGLGFTLVLSIAFVIVCAIFVRSRYNKLRDI